MRHLHYHLQLREEMSAALEMSGGRLKWRRRHPGEFDEAGMIGSGEKEALGAAERRPRRREGNRRRINREEIIACSRQASRPHAAGDWPAAMTGRRVTRVSRAAGASKPANVFVFARK